MTGRWPESVLEERRLRNEHYLAPDGPLSSEARPKFAGLVWFPIDAKMRLTATRLERYAMARPGNLGSTGDDPVVMEEVGVFGFDLLGARHTLLAFEPAAGEVDERYILIPFRDATTGNETYGAGRYLDLEPTPDDVYDLDFNRAYHPYCAYDDAWSCTLPPPQNRLSVRVEAGERL